MMNGVVTVITFIDKLKYARQSELQVQAELEHIERLHRIMRLPNRSRYTLQNSPKNLRRLKGG